jgi:hypothetical protein
MKKTAISVAALVIVLAGGWYLFSHSSAPKTDAKANETVAIVNGEKLSRASLTALETQIATQSGTSATSTDVQTQALNSLVAQTLLRQAVDKSGLTASTTQVDAQLQAAKSQFATPEAYQQALATQGLTEDQLKAQISANLVIQSYLDQQLHLSAVTVTDAEVQTAYNQVASTQQNVPALKDVKDQVKQMVIQQKQQQIINDYVAKLRSEGNVQVTI